MWIQWPDSAVMLTDMWVSKGCWYENLYQNVQRQISATVIYKWSENEFYTLPDRSVLLHLIMNATCSGQIWPYCSISIHNLKPRWTCVYYNIALRILYVLLWFFLLLHNAHHIVCKVVKYYNVKTVFCLAFLCLFHILFA